MTQDFEKTIRDHSGILHKMCRVYTFNENEYGELFQEMMIQIWSSLKNFRGESKISTWIYRVCINTALNFRTKIRKSKSKFEPLEGKIFVRPLEKIEISDQQKTLYAAIRKLKPIDRAIVGLYLEENSYEEIAEIIGLTKTNVATRLMRLKIQIIAGLEK